jgi:phage-related protein
VPIQKPVASYKKSYIIPGNPERTLARIFWEGDSREVLARFPKPIRIRLGFGLFEMQQGKAPGVAVRRMQSIGEGVFELKASDNRTWYRAIYLSVIDGVIHVLHCFEKAGRKTDKRDLKVATARLSSVRQRLEEQRRHGTHRTQ